MGITESDIKSYVTKACAIVDGAPLDYLTVNVPNGRTSRSFQGHATVVVGNKPIQQVCDETWGHVEDVVSSAAQEGKSEAIIKIILYRAKGPAGSRTWRTDTAPIGGDNAEDEFSNVSGMAGALVGAVREMRFTIKDLVGAIQASAMEGWRIAGEAIKAERQSTNDKAELMIALSQSQTSPADDAVKAIGVKIATDFSDVMKAKALVEMQQKAQEDERKRLATETKEGAK